MDLEAARTAMIDSQVRVNDVTDRRLISAMNAVPRETFVAPSLRASAYADLMVETGPGRWLIAAARLLQAREHCSCARDGPRARYRPGHGLFDRRAGQDGRYRRCAGTGRSRRQDRPGCRYRRVDVVAGPLKAGVASKGPFDVIFVNGAVEEVPQAWLDQLAEGGRLAVAVAEGGVRRARIYTRSGGKTA